MIHSHPLRWPDGWPRTADGDRLDYLAGWNQLSRRSLLAQCSRLHDEIRLLGATDIVVATNHPVRRDGRLAAVTRRMDDPGVAVYFTLGGRQMVLAQDEYWRLEDNIRSLALAVEGMRRVKRHGGPRMVAKAFDGFVALPGPGTISTWWHVLGVEESAPPDAVRSAYRRLIRENHPDAGGRQEDAQRINEAYAAAKMARSNRNRAVFGRDLRFRLGEWVQPAPRIAGSVVGADSNFRSCPMRGNGNEAGRGKGSKSRSARGPFHQPQTTGQAPEIIPSRCMDCGRKLLPGQGYVCDACLYAEQADDGPSPEAVKGMHGHLDNWDEHIP